MQNVEDYSHLANGSVRPAKGAPDFDEGCGVSTWGPARHWTRCDPRVHALAAKVPEILALEEDWDSYGARAIDPSLVEHALRLVARVLTTTMPGPVLRPVVGGTVQIEMECGQQELIIRILGLGKYQVSYYDEDRGIDLSEVVQDTLEPIIRFAAHLK